MTAATQAQTIEAPFQGDALDQFLQEMEGQPAVQSAEEGSPVMPPDPGGKYAGKSREEIIRMHQEAERLIGSRQAQPPVDGSTETAAPPAPAIDPSTYTPEMGMELYGETVGQAINAAGINPLEMAAKVQAGEDVSSYVDALVEKGSLPRELVTTYLQGVTPPAPTPGTPGTAGELTEADVARLRAEVGGDAEFERISGWAAANLAPADLAEYNRVVDEGNAAAISAWLRLLKVSSAEKAEPTLLGGGTAAGAERFTSDREAINARTAVNSRGQNRYDTEPAYRKWYEATLARSPVFM